MFSGGCRTAQEQNTTLSGLHIARSRIVVERPPVEAEMMYGSSFAAVTSCQGTDGHVRIHAQT